MSGQKPINFDTQQERDADYAKNGGAQHKKIGARKIQK